MQFLNKKCNHVGWQTIKIKISGIPNTIEIVAVHVHMFIRVSHIMDYDFAIY